MFCVHLQNAIDEAIEMYQELHMWDDCIAVAEAKVNLPDRNTCKQSVFKCIKFFFSTWI